MIKIKKADITQLDADCIVNAANSGLMAGGGVCGAIFSAAGYEQLQKTCDAIGGCETGSAVITPGFRLKAKFIIHAVGPQWCGGRCGEKTLLTSCYSASMQLAMENQCHSIAFPLISAGIYGYPPKQAWEIALRCVHSFQLQHPDYPLDVTFAVLSDDMLQMGNDVLSRITAPSAVLFHKPEEENGYLSNWYPCEFVVQGRTYRCTEQYMMEQKALLFGDTAIAQKIMETTDPQEMQALGQAVSNFDQTAWNGMKQLIVYRAVLEKFRQNPSLRQKLLETENKLLVECSRSDKVWGIGLGMNDPRAGDRNAWKGQNLLGYTLQAVREAVKTAESVSPSNRLHWSHNGNKVFWFAETNDGRQKLIRPDGTFTVCSESTPMFDQDRQSLAGWQRARLLMDEYGIWDATGFGCSMDTILAVLPLQQENRQKTVYLFSTCQKAEKDIYPHLPKKSVQECCQNVVRFYANPGLQAAWNTFILHPVCLKYTEGTKKFIPVYIGELGDGEGVLGSFRCFPLGSLREKETLQDIFSRAE